MSTKPTYQELEQQVVQLEKEIASLKKTRHLKALDNVLPDLVAELPAMVHSIDSSGSIVSVSNMWLQKLGYSREDVLGRKSTDFLSEKSRLEAVKKYLPEFFAQGCIENVPYEFVKKNGDILPVLLSALAVLKSGGEFHRSLAIMTDIAEMVQAEQLLLNSEEKFRTLTSLSPGGIFQTDREGNCTYTNEAWCQMTGLSEEEALGKGWIAALHPEDRANISSDWYSSMTNEGVWEKQFRFITPQGQTTWVYGQAVPQYNQQGNIIGYMGLNINITAQKNAEEEQLKIKRSYENAQRLAKVGNWEIDLQTCHMTWSKEVYRIFGRQQEDLLTYEKFITYVHEDDRSYHDSIFNLLKKEGKADFEYRLVRPDGEIRWVMGQGETVYSKEGVPKRMYGAIQDITIRKKADKSLEDRNTDLRLAQHIAGIGNWYFDPEVGVPVWSDEVYRIYERDPNKGPIPFENYQVVHPGESWNKFHSNYKRALREGLAYDIELVAEFPDGKRKELHLLCEPDPQSGPKGYFLRGTIQDITERKLAEDALRESEEKYRTLVELAQEGIWVIDKEGRTSFVNPNMAKMLGYSPEEMEDIHIFDFMDDQVKDQAEKNLDRRQQGIAEQHDFEFIHKDGRRIYTALATSPILDKNGNYEGAIAGVLDITERRKVELERRRLQVRLAQSQKMESIGNLAGGIAHDFNNILSSILGFTELAMQDAEKGTELEDSLQEVYAGGNRAKELVKQILAFARQSDEVTKPVQLSSIAMEVLKLIRSTIPASIEIEKDIESSSLVMGNPIQLHQVFLNLFTNASQAMREKGGILKIEMRDVEIDFSKKWDTLHLDEGDYIEVVISDTGEGIESDILEQIFEPYFTTKGPGEGSGMGLAVVSGIVESYGGKVIAESIPGELTHFFIYLPITSKFTRENSYKEEELPTGNERILFVDDEPPLARMGGRILERLGYSVETRTSSTEALELFRSKPDEFDLVITDMTMQHMMGDKFAIELQLIRSDIPIILCTGYSAIISEERAKEIGIKAFAYKPIAKGDFAKTIRLVLDEKHEIGEN